ncbi:Sporulation and spore germination [Micromonospora haikouensis]|uniref:Sporulation and spore germination n=1 Tax=Micromonospora haikouensis TaxID=686309 RepID=A0A1C4XKD3_9ACTN|nr:GerMN domain-containing protein [Micromonospora haikouensis]SCF08621.1 Sporulation and spore germination [Micromonospora haikouensis]
MSRRAARALLSALVVACTVAACGVPAEDTPRAVEAPPGPFPSPATVDGPATVGPVTVTLCFVRDDRLVPVDRRVGRPLDAEDQLRDLLAGPSAVERDSGLTSALPGAIGAGVVGVADGQARVRVDGTGDDTGRSDEVLAFGQIVCTLAARDDVDAVAFLRDGRPLGVPRADGSLSAQPLTPADYAALTAIR